MIDVINHHRPSAELLENPCLPHLREGKRIVLDPEQFYSQTVGIKIPCINLDIRPLGLMNP